jgi:Tfp pilus assembly protein PilE
MKMAKLILFLLSFSISAQATPRKPSNAKVEPVCTRCPEIQKLEASFLALKYEERKDRSAGRKLMVRVMAQLERFHTLKKSTATAEEFNALINLVAAALPYDQGTESAESIASLISESRSLKATFDQALNGVNDSCRQQLLRAVMIERLCMISVEDRGQTNQRSLSCVSNPVFRYDECIGMKTVD